MDGLVTSRGLEDDGELPETVLLIVFTDFSCSDMVTESGLWSRHLP